MSKKSDNSLLKNVAGIAGILLAFVFILRLTLAPLYQEMDHMESLQQQQLASESRDGNSDANDEGGGEDEGGSGGSGENINVNLGGLGGWFNWALGWAWGGPGWYRGPDYGWWGANVWNGWRNWWGGGGNNNRVWNGNVNETFNRDGNNQFRNDQIHSGGHDDFHSGGDRESHGGGHGEFHGGGDRGGGHGGHR